MSEQTYCPTCGPVGSVDEDCCCHSCGCYVCEAQVVAAIRSEALQELRDWINMVPLVIGHSGGDLAGPVFAVPIGVLVAKLDEMEGK